MRIVIVLALLALCGCVSAPRPAAFGGQVALGADCKELSGKYLNAATHSTGEGPESLSTLIGRIVQDAAAKSAPVSFTLSFPANRVLRIAYFDLKGGDAGEIELREQKAEYRCGDGVLQIASGIERFFSTGTETLAFSRTTGNYLMVHRSSVKLAPAGGGIPLPGMREDWYVFTPL